ncbi:MAG: hypothetical protein V4548_13515 [Bacteroidota bacterium]
MPQGSYILLELMINKFSEFIEWIFQKRKKTEIDKLEELNSILIKQFNFSFFDISENTYDILIINLEKLDSRMVDDIISSLFKLSISKSKNQIFQKLKSNQKLNERIIEIILFTENKYNKLSLESRNVKNSLQHIRASKSS